MDELIENCAALWHESYEKKVIEILKRGKTGQKLPREEYHILNTYNVVSLVDVEKVKRRMENTWQHRKEFSILYKKLTQNQDTAVKRKRTKR